MSVKKKTINFIKELASEVFHILFFPVTVLSDKTTREEFQRSLGIPVDPNAPDPVFPPGSSLDAYFKNEKSQLEIQKQAAAILELLQFSSVIAGFIHASAAYASGQAFDSQIAAATGAEKERLKNAKAERIKVFASELVTALFNLGFRERLRRKYPYLHGVFYMLILFDEQAQRAGGSGFILNVLGDFFSKAWNGLIHLENEENIKNATDLIYAALLITGQAIGDDWGFIASSGFEPNRKSHTPFADKAADSVVSVAKTIAVGETVSISPVLSFALIPTTRIPGGGFALHARIGSGYQKYFDNGWFIDIAGDPEIAFFYSKPTGFETTLGGLLNFRLAGGYAGEGFSGSLPVLSLLVNEIGVKGFALQLAFSADDVIVSFVVDFSYNIAGKGDATVFPFTKMSDTPDEDIIRIPVAYSFKKNDFFIEGAGSLLPPPKEKSSSTERDPLGPASSPSLFLIRFPMHRKIGPFEFEHFYLGLSQRDNSIPLEASFDFNLRLGDPVLLSFTRMGAYLGIEPKSEEGWFFGRRPFIDFKPPSGAGITVDAKVVKGGGFLRLDPDRGEYEGVLELDFCGEFSLKAVGVLHTKVPNVPGNYALLVLISTEFNPGWPLGCGGLTLNGLGGLLALNRVANVDVIRESLKTSALDSVLFPENPAANVSRILAQTSAMFPIPANATSDKSFIVGVMAKMSWGEGGFSLKLGIVYEHPARRILLPGVLRGVKKAGDVTLYNLQVNFLGEVDLEKQFVALRADLVNSRLVRYELHGSFALALCWGEQPFIGFSIGGFHPAFSLVGNQSEMSNDPTKPTQLVIPELVGVFRNMDRFGVRLISGTSRWLSAEGYFAFTSNTVQLGLRAEFFVDGPLGFNLYGLFGLDVLLQVDPFQFLLDLVFIIEFRHGSSVIAGLSVEGHLSGPSERWHIEGKAKIKIGWFFSISIPFSHTWGDEIPDTAIGAENLEKRLLLELAEHRNWHTELPAFTHLHVTFREIAAPTDDNTAPMYVQPVGALVFSQRVLPLGRNIDKFGTKKVSGARQFQLREIKANGIALPDPPVVREQFAPAQFIEMSDSEKLARPSFERMESGVRLEQTGLSAAPDFVMPKPLTYEKVYTHTDAPPPKETKTRLPGPAFSRLSKNAAPVKSALSGRRRAASEKSVRLVEIKTAGYLIARTDNLKTYQTDANPVFAAQSQAEATQLLRSLVQGNPGLEGQIQVVHRSELVT